MINIVDNHNCCGCSACASICPKQCISMAADKEGFLYPLVDKNICIECGLCEKVCNELHPYEKRKPYKVLAAINKDEDIRMKSSSGGIFYILAAKIICEGGVVFGARFDENWQVVIDYATDIKAIDAFMGSKYVQARIENAYRDAKPFLTEGRKVLFSGTPCQVAGLHKFLHKQYENLLTVDFICHGVPSPKVWRMYLNEVTNDIKNLHSAEFRSKVAGWKNFCMYLNYDKGNKNFSYIAPMTKDLYMRAFLQDLILRPSCHNCKAKGCSSLSDITIADFWGVQFIIPEMDDNKGTSLLLVHSAKVDALLKGNQLLVAPIDFEMAVRYNTAVYTSPKPHTNRELFFLKLDKEPLSELIQKCAPLPKINFAARCKSFIKRNFKR